MLEILGIGAVFEAPAVLLVGLPALVLGGTALCVMGCFRRRPAPVVTSIALTHGVLGGNTAVTINGANFVDGATVTIGGQAATNVVFVNATQLTANTPAHAAGAVDVTVTNPDTQQGTLVNGYTYDPAPTVTSIDPTHGVIGGNTAVTIDGTNFVDGATVTIGGQAATNVVFVDATQLTANTPAHAAGAVDVTVTNPDTQQGTLVDGYTYDPPPRVDAVVPNPVSTMGGTHIAINGAHFVDGATVTIDGRAPSNVAFVSVNQLTATTRGHAAGQVDVIVTNPDQQSGTLVNGLEYSLPPKVKRLNPDNGASVGGTQITIHGANFVDGATVTIGGQAATNVVFVGANQLTATTPAHAVGSADVVVTNPDTLSGTCQGGFRFFSAAPVVNALNPNHGPAAGNADVTINGANFVDGATVTIGGQAAANVAYVSQAQLTASTPAHAAGQVGVTVTNPDNQQGTLGNGYTFDPAPTVTAVDPALVDTAGGALLVIDGTGFVDGATVTVGGQAATNVMVTDATQLQARAPAHAAGQVDVIVTNPDQQSGTLVNGVTYAAAPVVNSVAPNRGPVAGNTAVTINGANFVNGVTVTIGGQAAGNVLFIGANQITADTPANGPGPADVEVTNPNLQSHTLAGGFTYAPTVTVLNLVRGPAAGGTNVTITGTGFADGATVALGGSAATNVVVVNATQITATTAAHAAGQVDVVVTNPGAITGTLVNGFTYHWNVNLPGGLPDMTHVQQGVYGGILGNFEDHGNAWAGHNRHQLFNDRAGQWARDIPGGSREGSRGGLRVCYTVNTGTSTIDIVDVVDYH